MDFHTPELTLIFREELDERSRRLVAGARSLADRTLAADTIPDLIRDAHTVKGSSALLGFDAIKEAGQRLEKLWRMVGDGFSPDRDVIVAMEATAGCFVATLDGDNESELADLVERLDSSLEHTEKSSEVVPLRHPDAGSLGGLLSSVSESLMGGATCVDTGDLYRMINRIVEVALDADALADLSLVSIEGADPGLFGGFGVAN